MIKSLPDDANMYNYKSANSTGQKHCICKVCILPDGIIEDIREFFQIEDSHFEHFYTKPLK